MATKTTVIEPTAVDFEFDAEQFDELNALSSISYAQIITPDDKDMESYGLFVSSEQADKAGFVPNEHWELNYPVLGGKVKKYSPETGTAGYFLKNGHSARVLVLYRSSKEVYKDKEDGKGKNCLGYYYSQQKDADGKLLKSQAGIEADEAKTRGVRGYQISQRYLLLFLNDDDTPMSESPLSLRISTVYGIGFDDCQRSVKSAYAACFREKVKRGMNQGDFAYATFEFKQGLRETKDGTVTVYVSARNEPTTDMSLVGKPKTEDKGVYVLDVTYTSWSAGLFKGRKTPHPLQGVVAGHLEKFDGFIKPPSMRNAAAPAVVDEDEGFEVEPSVSVNPVWQKYVELLQRAANKEQVGKAYEWVIADRQYAQLEGIDGIAERIQEAMDNSLAILGDIPF